MTLMCKDKPIYDVRGGKVINAELMPGSILNGMGFTDWARHRRSVLSNVFARKLYFSAFGYGPEELAERRTHILSLSDCYWLKHEGESVQFKDVSPYHADFWGGGCGNGKDIGKTSSSGYNGGAIPTLYTQGAVSKRWFDRERLFKEGCFVELEAYRLAIGLGIQCNKVEASQDKTGVIVHNITNENIMLEPAVCSGKFKGDFFPTIPEIIDVFGEAGRVMLAFDAVTGNTDRHLENFGFLRDADTGEYKGMAPLYDFDQVLSADGTDDFLISQLPKHPIIQRICENVLSVSTHPVFCMRAQAILASY